VRGLFYYCLLLVFFSGAFNQISLSNRNSQKMLVLITVFSETKLVWRIKCSVNFEIFSYNINYLMWLGILTHTISLLESSLNSYLTVTARGGYDRLTFMAFEYE